MKRPLINHTNHSSRFWQEGQRQAGESWGPIVDFPFPSIPPEWDEEKVKEKAVENAARIQAMEPAAVLLQGEFTYSYDLITLLKEAGIPVLAACSRRDVEERQEEGKSVKTAVFRFVRFRKY